MEWGNTFVLLVLALGLASCGRLRFEFLQDTGANDGGSDAFVDGSSQDGSVLDGMVTVDGGLQDGMVNMDAQVQDASTTDSQVDSAVLCAGWVFGTPRRLDEVNTAAADWNPDITDDGLVLVWATNADRLYIADRANTTLPFSNVREMTELGGDSDPTLSGDGLVIHYVSGGQLHRAERTARGVDFGVGQPVAFTSSPGNLFGADVLDGELQLVAGSGATSDDARLVVWERASVSDSFGNPRQIASLESGLTFQSWPGFSGPRTVVYQRGTGLGDVRNYVATRPDDQSDVFTEQQQLELQSNNEPDGDPKLSDDGRWLVFASLRGANDWDLYIAERICQ